jgi:lipopolysaccharide export system permease protein
MGPKDGRMGLIERYIFRRTLVAFLATLTVLTGVVWVTQALRQLDLVTAKGQAIGAFLAITGLALPFLILLIAPFAVVIAAITTLAVLNADSELVVMQGSGASRWRTLKPVLAIGVAVGLLAALLTFWAAPAGLREVREALTRVRIDLVASIIRPGRFIEIDDGLTFHIRERTADGGIVGIVLDDERDAERSMTYLANGGQIVEALDRTLLVMTNGTIQRRIRKDGSLSIVRFDAYAFDLSNLMPDESEPVYRPSERTIFELASLDPTDAYVVQNRGRFRAELHDRLSQPLYPVAFALIVFLFLGEPRTSRQGRSMAILGAIVAVTAVRLTGFGAGTLAVRFPAAVAAVYAVPLIVIAGSLAMILSDRRMSLPAPLARLADAAGEAADALARRVIRAPRGA